ncbi:hypothetical protein F5I97DRAFT_35654 [Phlebopus sp. FC_14]|nr:hypothetical protein F5I97DRAFT_35654 [Phlebopus sp. FC_14]
MLIIGPNSTCDVCLEGYSSGSNIPHSIACGHVFCHKCLEHLTQHKCPLCRTRFLPQDIRKLHVDRDPTALAPLPTTEDSIEPSATPPPVNDEGRRLLSDIARVIKEGAKIHEIRGLVGQCRAYYKSLPGDENPVRISCLLLYHLADSQGKLRMQAEQLREAHAARDEVRERLTSELDAAELKYRELERTSRDEKETALAIEKSLREHYDQMNSYWKSQLQTAERERRSLQEALDKARSSQSIVPPRPVELRPFHTSETRRPSFNMGDPLPLKKDSPNGKLLNEDIDFHLSPLAEASAPLASTVQSLRALSDESDEEDLNKNPGRIEEETQVDSEMEQSNAETPMAYPLRQPAAVDPITIPSRTPLSRQASSVSMSVNPDYRPSGISSSRPRDDVVMNSHPPSPSRRHSSERQAMVYGPRPRDSYVREMELKDMKPRNPSDQASKDQIATWNIVSSSVSKLHDLLDSPQPSSLHTHMLQRSEYPDPTLSRPTSRPSAPSRPSSTQYPSTSTSLAKYPDDPIPTDRRPLVRASDVAMQLEKERLEKLEKERNRRRDTPISSSLKDTTNAPVDSHHHPHRHKHGNGKMKAVHPIPGTTFA